ncbi:response regulator transcription factor [Rhodoblastus acidophilus]|uniref:Response regulator transcription factor n=1 Tax=Candidatus Rhodoblastus alkanivorans TaxID=2954117 RepID=A0ABS9Z1T4_9HYPH|nr:response regulator transcription factor [Candidatus Rhodoblastus alkanivorans]MCI4678030.1 response regulator transcription factor [Candidatus Rhodoblastus alkanivorans]MCI4681629.1 response regulator transcription factor [Candidatus Rhodoblastus alkanivorans]MDI4642677.1 response regulator transcription factor [Rhodoblastus acidophilus]
MRLLLIEDTPRLRELLIESVHAAGWRIDAFGTCAEAEEALSTTAYDLLLLDLGLPDGDGIELIRALRRQGRRMPILVLTARSAVDERISGLDAGADDYLVKPFNHGEFLARCRALLRRSPEAAPPVLTAGRLVFDPAAGVLTCEGRDLGLTPRERTVAEILMREVGRAVPKRKLEHALSEFGDDISTNAVELAISRLRKKLNAVEPGAALETIRGLGYLLRELNE